MLLYAMVHHRRPSMTRCLPAGSDLTRDFVKEEIHQNVDLVEELDAASIVLIVLHILITFLGILIIIVNIVLIFLSILTL